MIVYKNYVAFTILGEEIILYSDETSYGRSTVAEINGTNYYLDNEPPSIGTAIIAWQDYHDKLLTDEEFKKVMAENQLNSEAI
jgi:hypothetical protein